MIDSVQPVYVLQRGTAEILLKNKEGKIATSM
jgi:hypothetical protein